MKKTFAALVAFALLVPAFGWAAEEKTVNPSEDLILASLFFTNLDAFLAATVAEEESTAEEEVKSEESNLSDRLSLSTWLSWGGAYNGESHGAVNGTRVRIDADLTRGFSATLEHDFVDHFNGAGIRRPLESGLKKAQIQWSGDLPKGGSITMAAGQQLDPVAFLYPSPAGIHTVRYPSTLGGYSIYSRGASVTLEGDLSTFRMLYDTEDERLSATAAVGPVSLFWDNTLGYGFLVEHYLNPRWSVEAGLDEHEANGNRLHVGNHVQVSPILWVFAGLDENLSSGQSDLSAGATWEFAPTSFFKLFWHQDEGERGELAAQVTYSRSF